MQRKERSSCGIMSLAILIPCLGVASAAGAETFAFESLRHPLTARQTIWGGLSPSAQDGAAMIRANPAGLVHCARPVLDVGYQTWQFGLQQHWVGSVLPMRPVTIAGGVSAVRSGALPVFDVEGNRLGTFVPVEMAIELGVARAFSERVAVGVAAQALRLSTEGDDLRGLSVAVGGQARLLGWTVGGCLRNLGADVEGVTGTYGLPTELSLGINRCFWRGASLSLNTTVDRNGENRIHGGTRWVGPGGLALLAGAAYRGYDTDPRLSLRAGLELDLRALWVSYGYIPNDDLGPTHHLSLQFRMGGGGTSAQTSPSHPNEDLDCEPDVGRQASGRAPGQSWAVWGGTYRSEEGAQKEVRALRVQRIDGADVVATPEGFFRVRVACGLDEAKARAMARLLHATYSEE